MERNGLRMAVVWLALVALAGVSPAYRSGDDNSVNKGTSPSNVAVPGGLQMPLTDGIEDEETLDAFPEQGAGRETPAGDIPDTLIELAPDMAKRAIDALDAVYEDFTESGLEEFDTLEEFVANSDAGRKFEASLKKFDFANVTDWDKAITAISLTYHDIIDHESESLHERIRRIRKDPGYDDETRDKLLAEIEALIPSTNNRNVIQLLIDDQVYREKLERLLTLE